MSPPVHIPPLQTRARGPTRATMRFKNHVLIWRDGSPCTRPTGLRGRPAPLSPCRNMTIQSPVEVYLPTFLVFSDLLQYPLPDAQIETLRNGSRTAPLRTRSQSPSNSKASISPPQISVVAGMSLFIHNLCSSHKRYAMASPSQTAGRSASAPRALEHGAASAPKPVETAVPSDTGRPSQSSGVAGVYLSSIPIVFRAHKQ